MKKMKRKEEKKEAEKAETEQLVNEVKAILEQDLPPELIGKLFPEEEKNLQIEEKVSLSKTEEHNGFFSYLLKKIKFFLFKHKDKSEETETEAALIENKEKRIQPRIKIRKLTGAEANSRIFYTTTEISQTQIENFWRPLRDSSSEYLKKVGPVGTELLKKILALQGVEEVWIHPYEIFVIIGEAFDWEDIEPRIIEFLKKTFVETKPEEIEIIVENSKY